jgi:hypothetical protein
MRPPWSDDNVCPLQRDESSAATTAGKQQPHRVLLSPQISLYVTRERFKIQAADAQENNNSGPRCVSVASSLLLLLLPHSARPRSCFSIYLFAKLHFHDKKTQTPRAEHQKQHFLCVVLFPARSSRSNHNCTCGGAYFVVSFVNG